MPRPPKVPSPPRETTRIGSRARDLERRYFNQSVVTTQYANEVVNDPPGGLVLYWKLDELSGLVAADSSGNGRNGTLPITGVTLGLSPLADGYAAGFARSGFYGHNWDGGSNANVRWQGVYTPTTQLSCECWIKTTQSGSSNPYFFNVNGGSTAAPLAFLFLDATGAATFQVESPGAAHTLVGTSVINDGAVHHVVGTYDGATMSLYVNGVLDASVAMALGLNDIFASGDAVIVANGRETGSQIWDHGFTGTLDEFAFYTVALSAAEVGRHYSAGGAGAGSPGGTPTGAAGGDLAGTYPNPSLVAFGPGAEGPIGDSTHVAAVSIDAKGRVSALSSVAITFPAASGGLALTPSPGSNTTGDGVKADMTAGETLAFGDPVYVKSDGKVWKADADTAGLFPGVGIALGAAAANATVTVLFLGFARNDSWAWTVGGLVYLSTSSGLTQTQPSATDNAIQIIGVATAATRLYVNPQLVYITHT